VSNTLETLINHLKLQRQHDSDMVSQLKQVRETITVREMKILINTIRFYSQTSNSDKSYYWIHRSKNMVHSIVR
jgi:hypothetical protein